jgi:hypothetical protein
VYRRVGGTAGQTEEWVDSDGAPVAQPPPDPEVPRAVPAYTVTVNGQPAGDFDDVLSYGGSWYGKNYPQQFGFLQPDGRVFVYAVEGNRLLRLWFR